MLQKCTQCLVSATLERKMGDKTEMCRMILRLFPGITGVQDDKELEYYHTLVNTYFAPIASTTVPAQVEVSFWVGSSLGRAWADTGNMTGNFMPAMRSAKGRTMIIAAIREWRAATVNKHESYYYWKRSDLQKLDVLAESVSTTDFAVINNRITSQYEPQYLA